MVRDSPYRPGHQEDCIGLAWADGHNDALRKAVPEQFVRSLMVASRCVDAPIGVKPLHAVCARCIIVVRAEKGSAWDAAGAVGSAGTTVSNRFVRRQGAGCRVRLLGNPGPAPAIGRV